MKIRMALQCMDSTYIFMKKQIRQVINKCPGTKAFHVREDIMIDCYATTNEMLFCKGSVTKYRYAHGLRRQQQPVACLTEERVL